MLVQQRCYRFYTLNVFRELGALCAGATTNRTRIHRVRLLRLTVSRHLLYESLCRIYASQAVSVAKVLGHLSSNAVWRIAVSSSAGNIHSIRSSCAATVCGVHTVVIIEK